MFRTEEGADCRSPSSSRSTRRRASSALRRSRSPGAGSGISAQPPAPAPSIRFRHHAPEWFGRAGNAATTSRRLSTRRNIARGDVRVRRHTTDDTGNGACTTNPPVHLSHFGMRRPPVHLSRSGAMVAESGALPVARRSAPNVVTKCSARPAATERVPSGSATVPTVGGRLRPVSRPPRSAPPPALGVTRSDSAATSSVPSRVAIPA